MSEFIRKGNDKMKEVAAQRLREGTKKFRQAQERLADEEKNDQNTVEEAMHDGREALVMLSESNEFLAATEKAENEGVQELLLLVRKYYPFLESDEEAEAFVAGLFAGAQALDNNQNAKTKEIADIPPAWEEDDTPSYQPEEKTQPGEGQAERKSGKGVYERELKNLTEPQYMVARMRLRLLHQVDRETMYQTRFFGFESIFGLMKSREELAKKYEYDKILLGYSQNWSLAEAKLRRALTQIEDFSFEETQWPLGEAYRSQLPQLPDIIDIFWRMDLVPAYQGLTFEKILEYTKRKKPIDLVEYNPGVSGGEVGRDDNRDDNDGGHDEQDSGYETDEGSGHHKRGYHQEGPSRSGGRVQREQNVVHEDKFVERTSSVGINVITPRESAFLALRLLESGYKMVESDQRKLERATRNISLTDVQETQQVSASLLEKFQRYFELDEAQQNVYLTEQDEMPMVLLAFIIQNWNSFQKFAQLLA